MLSFSSLLCRRVGFWSNFFFLKGLFWGWHSASQANPPLLYLQSSSLLMVWEGSREWFKTLGPCTCEGDLKEASGIQILTRPPLAIVVIWND